MILPVPAYAHGYKSSSGMDNVFGIGGLQLKIDSVNPTGEASDNVVKGLDVSDNGVTRMNDGHLMIKVSGYSERSIMKYVTSMGYTLPKKFAATGAYDCSYQNGYSKITNDGLFVKSAIEAEKGSNIFLLATGGVGLNSDNGSISEELFASNLFVGGGVGYFDKSLSMQLGYDNKVGVSASFGFIW